MSPKLNITLRNVTLADSDLLLSWRNDPVTVANSRGGPLTKENHEFWLKGILADPERVLLIAEDEGEPLGTVRADLVGDGWVLSWTTAPKARGRGVGKAMVKKMVNRLTLKIKAVVRCGNDASCSIAEYVGMSPTGIKDGFIYYEGIPRIQSPGGEG